MRCRGHAQQSAGSLRILRRKDSNGFLRLADRGFEIYEHIGNNLRKFLLLLGCMTVLFLSEFLCLYLIKDTEISLAAGVSTAILVLAALTALAFARKLRHDKLAKRIELYSENYLRSCITEALYKAAGSDELLDYSVGTIILKKVVNTEDTTTITADVCVSETYLPENKKPYTKKPEEHSLCKEQDTPIKERRTESFSSKRTARPAEPISFLTKNTAVRSADTVSMRITPNGSC